MARCNMARKCGEYTLSSTMMMELDLGTAAPAIKHHQSSTGVGGGNGERRRVPQNCDSKSLTGTPASSHYRHQ